MKIKTIDYYWWRRLGSILYQRASSRLFIPRGDDVFSLCIKWTSLAFITVATYEFKWDKKNVKPKYRANLFKHLFFCFILWFTSSWPFRFTDDFLQVLLYWSRSTTKRSGTTQRFVAVDLLIFYILVFYACSGDLFARFQALAGCWFPLTKTPRVPETFHARTICLPPTPKHQAAREEKKLWYPGWQCKDIYQLLKLKWKTN